LKSARNKEVAPHAVFDRAKLGLIVLVRRRPGYQGKKMTQLPETGFLRLSQIKPGQEDAAYLLHLDGGIPVGGFQNWRDGRGRENWRADVGRPPSASEEVAYRATIEAAPAARHEEEVKRHDEAAEKAAQIWSGATPCDGKNRHPYLITKGVSALGLKEMSDGRLLVPLRDAVGSLRSLQFISADGSKRFLPGGRKTGCYFSI
jgi:putative DNA primase/helicase